MFLYWKCIATCKFQNLSPSLSPCEIKWTTAQCGSLPEDSSKSRNRRTGYSTTVTDRSPFGIRLVTLLNFYIPEFICFSFWCLIALYFVRRFVPESSVHARRSCARLLLPRRFSVRSVVMMLVFSILPCVNWIQCIVESSWLGELVNAYSIAFL